MRVFFFLLISYMSMAQEIIPLYPDGVPGLKVKDVPEKMTGANITNVTVPTLAIYKPQKQTSNAAVVICPGGGYAVLAYKKEGEDLARWFSERGMIAVVLKYRLPQREYFTDAGIRPLQDAQSAIAFVKSHAKEWGIKDVGIMGFSAGGHLAATTSTLFDNPVGEIKRSLEEVRPDFSLLIYPVISLDDNITHEGSKKNLLGPNFNEQELKRYSPEKNITEKTPPVFLVSTTDDWVVSENSIAYYLAAKRHKVPAEMHIYEKGGHGYALTKDNRGPVEKWPEALEAWLKLHKWL
ncbi:alpha/beta hydrolase [Leadbetterella byssophila]|uniref:alpha/beta hydrolase n=1 Tax=Leadbetterella byssophila TaxID=316068 RepID=UPI0039A354DE